MHSHQPSFIPTIPTPSAPLVVPEVFTVALPRPADACYELFCAIEIIPEWLRVVRTTVVTHRDRHGRARQAAFLARLQGATVGYSLLFRHRSMDRWLGWTTPDGSSITVLGSGEFAPLGDRSCLMTYSLLVNLPRGGLPGWGDAHAASSTMIDFRDFVMRTL